MHDKIAAAVFSTGQAYANLRVLCDEIGGRLAGTPQGEAAQQFVRDRFAESGLQNVRLQPFELTGWRRGAAELQVVHPRPRPLSIASLGYVPATPEPLEMAVVDVGYGHESELKERGEVVRGCLALAEKGARAGERPLHRSEKMLLAARVGAAAFAHISDRAGNLPRVGTGGMGKLTAIPAVGISREDGLWLRRAVDEQKVVVRLFLNNWTGPVTAANVLGEIPGREHNSALVVAGGHLDAWDIGTGALDNGTGTVVLMEAARALALLGASPRRTIRFAAFMGEEVGLCGSKHCVQQAEEELDSTVMMLNVDIIGAPTNLCVHTTPSAKPHLQQIAARLAPLGVLPEVKEGAGLHSDHAPFMLAGVPTISIGSQFPPETTAFCHSAGDTLDKVTPGSLGLAAATVAGLLWEIAELPEPLASRLSKDQLREVLEKNKLKEPLQLMGEWPFVD